MQCRELRWVKSMVERLSRINAVAAYVISVVVGATAWLGLMVVTGEHEAWDDRRYFTLALPLVAIAAGIMGFIVPHRPWRWGVTMMATQALVALVMSRSANLLPFGLVIFAVLAVPCVVLAYLGSFIRRKMFML
jgi:peptidoglycan/LPS O-acetylase OafA/YrhL